MSEQLTTWTALKVFEGEYYLEHLSNNPNDFYAFFLSKKNDRIKIELYGHIYRITQRQCSIIAPELQLNDCLAILKGSNTPYIQWIKKLCGCILDAYDPDHAHFSIVASDFVVDVISSLEPQFFLKE